MTASAPRGFRWRAKAKPHPIIAATWAPYSLEPRIQIGGRGTSAGAALTVAKGWSSGKPSPAYASSSASWEGKSSAPNASAERRSAAAVTPSVPGARPMPRSMRPGKRPSSTRKVSATCREEWLGSMMPPDPTRIRAVAAATWPIITSGAELASPGVLWCSASQ